MKSKWDKKTSQWTGPCIKCWVNILICWHRVNSLRGWESDQQQEQKMALRLHAGCSRYCLNE
uniref:Uncharacterized protein n=1 Tax=Helianthus annuus TaxID=4232 RepID=A0A251T8A5_HELAN